MELNKDVVIPRKWNTEMRLREQEKELGRKLEQMASKVVGVQGCGLGHDSVFRPHIRRMGLDINLLRKLYISCDG